MTTSPDLGIVQLSQNQANPDITFNTAFITIQALLNGVLDKDLTAPPGSPAEGDAYLINSAAPTGAWVGHAKQIAIFWGGVWNFVPGLTSAGTIIVPGVRNKGLAVYVRDEAVTYTWSGAAWVAGAITAAAVTFTPTGTIAATDVQAAIAEAASEAVQKAGDTMTGGLNINSAAAIALHPKQTTSGLTVTDAAQVIESTDAGANGPSQILYHNSASPAVNDIFGRNKFAFNSSTGVVRDGTQIIAFIDDPVNATEDTRLGFLTYNAGTAAARAWLGAGLFMSGALTDPGAGNINAAALQESGVALTAKYAQLGAANTFSLAQTINAKLLINLSGATPPAQLAGSQVAQVVGAAGTMRINWDSLAGFPAMTLRRTNTTFAAPSNVLNTDILGTFTFTGFGSTIYTNGGATLVVSATQDWTDTASGTRIDLRTTAKGSITPTNRWTIEDDGGLYASSLAASLGNGSINAKGVIKPGVFTVGTLPAAATVGSGARAQASDATVNTYGAAPIGSGALSIPVNSTGAAWQTG